MPETLVAIEGGLDLRSASINAPKGTLSSCFNFEKDQGPGLVRRPGWVRYDGRVTGPEIDDALFIRFDLADLSGFFEYAEQVRISCAGFPDQDAIVVCCSAGGPLGPALILAYPIQEYSQWADLSIYTSNLTTVFGSTSGSTLVGWASCVLMNDSSITIDQYDFYKNVIKSMHSDAVGKVPGRNESPVDAIFTYADKSYAIHDCVTFTYTSGTNNFGGPVTNVCEGHCLRDEATGNFLGRILSVSIDSGTLDTSTAAGSFVVYDYPLGQAFPATNDRIDLFDASNSVMLINRAFRFGSIAAASPNQTRALLYETYEQYVKTYPFLSSYGIRAIEPPWFTAVAPPTWSRPRLTRELPYKMDSSSGGFGPNGSSDYSIYEYSRLGLSPDIAALNPQSTGEKFPTVATDVSGTRWINPNNILVQDAAVANYTPIGQNTGLQTAQLVGTAFDFSAIPDGSTILGVTFRMRASTGPAAGSFFVGDVRLTSASFPNGVGSQNLAQQFVLTTVLTDYTFGGNENAWGEQLTTNVIKDASFGVSVRFQKANPALVQTVNVDAYALTVHYAPPTRTVYIRNQLIVAAPSQDVVASIIHYCIDSGDFTTQTATGVLSVFIGDTEAEGTSAGKIRRLAAGNEIRTAPSNPATNAAGGTLLGIVAAEDYPVSFPPGAALDAATSRYEVIDANFWDVPEGRAAYIVNGAEYGSMFDGTFLVRIRTGQPAINDCPRHVAAHLSYLHLGFASGAVVNTGTGKPLSVLGAAGNSVVNFGEPVTGMLTLNGSTLGIWTDRSTRGLQGTSPGGYTPLMISPAINCIEYSLVNLVGEAVWASYRGIETVRTISAYGDFETLPLSASAQNWLQGRLQVDFKIGAIPSRLVYSIGVRNKRQYRAFFADGYVFTLTLFDAGDLPVCTVQRIARPNSALPSGTGFNDEPWDAGVIRHVHNGTRTDGKELILASFENQNADVIPAAGGTNIGPYFPYGVRLDCGYVDDAATFMPAYVEFNAFYSSYPTQNVQWQGGTLFINAYGGSRVTVYTKVNFDGPIFDTAALIQSRTAWQPLPTDVREQVIDMQIIEQRAFIPVPQRYVIFDVSAEGRMLKLRVDGTQVGGSTPSACPYRITHVSLTTEGHALDRP